MGRRQCFFSFVISAYLMWIGPPLAHICSPEPDLVLSFVSWQEPCTPVIVSSFSFVLIICSVLLGQFCRIVVLLLSSCLCVMAC